VKLVALLGLAGVAALATMASPAGATNECRGFQVCAPVAGPWVVVPTATTVPRPKVEYQLSCPKGFVVGGLDAELTDRGIDVSFEALLGSPVNPGITTRRAAVFTGRAVAGPVRAATFRPHVGCLPAAGGGTRIPTVAHVYPPGHPAIRHVWTVRVQPGTQAVRKACANGEQLVAASHAVGFYGKTPPSARLVGSVHATRVVRDGQVTVSIRAGSAVQNVKAIVQIDLTCAGGT
jgi:hypothetical protein